MYVKQVVIRLTALLCLASKCFSHDTISTSKRPLRPAKYPQKVHALFESKYGKNLNHNGVWSAWGAWSECSRTCGGGIMTQTRYCIHRPSDSRFFKKQQKRYQNITSGCIGLYKRIHLCNLQECPFGTPDSRREQCSSFNMKKYKGKFYDWEPFLGVEAECALNCRPAGMNFYATLNKTVIDGTPCSRPISSTGKPAPHGTRGVCVSGECKSVDSRGVVGSADETSSECPACSRGPCRSINGIYSRSNLQPGYSMIAKMPKGACRIIVQQLEHSRNFIALKEVNSTFIINGDWKFSTTSRFFAGAGTRFAYIKQDSVSLETITAQGPLGNPIEIYLVSYQPNVELKYGYLLPNDIEKQIAPPSTRVLNRFARPHDEEKIVPHSILQPNSHNKELDGSLHSSQQDEPKSLTNYHHRQRRVRKRFSWKINGISACSKSCGGGIQTTVVSCVRELTQTPVPDRRCAHLEKPNSNPIRCNIQDCPPRWSGSWSSCSVSCGSGIQQYVSQCKQELNTRREVIVDDVQCSGRPRPLLKTKSCTQVDCDLINNEVPKNKNFKSNQIERDWLVGDWSTCSVTCGTGHRSRSVSCPSGHCPPQIKPPHAEYCTLPSCSSISRSPKPTETSEISPWLVTEWSKCSEVCGTGIQSRYAVCGRNTCDVSSKPDSTRDCSSEKQCGGHWFTGAWGECPESCSGQSHQIREVICVVKQRGQFQIVNEMTCPNHLKPLSKRACDGKCDPYWFSGDWGNCENCPNGIQRRVVRCMDANGIPSSRCQDSNTPPSKRSCNCQKKKDKDTYKPPQDQPIDQTCTDKIRNCYLAVQARLCQYPYYKSQCCTACRKTPLDHV
ncbi:thrombospondin type-1 domain-containing protein 4-like isoform X2 [Coccinella septempunctata]|uniref:thrombospondin type-1 domain-containing protein 4-like isoform X2 n=1 Tax=Coccinella septempunctata TaxID=41139 RepID=UPI001D070B14|nr:thrombospondin type-1 domain-containing protein 4-like isoform X2 [Coccinella septempunctata]